MVIAVSYTHLDVYKRQVWRDMAGSRAFSVQEAVYRYGYADQAHLLNEFKRFHGVTPGEAMRIAMDNR